MGKVSPEYTNDEIDLLRRSATNFLGWEVALQNLEIEGNPGKNLEKMILDTKKKAVIAVSEVEFYPTQDEKWQRKIDTVPVGQKRRPMQIYSGMAMGHPLVSVLLQRKPTATTDPLAVIKRVIAATPDGKVDEFSWKKLLTHEALGVPDGQMAQFAQAVNFSETIKQNAPFHLRKFGPRMKFQTEEFEPNDDAHEDNKGTIALTKAAKDEVRQLLLKLMQERLA